MPSYRDHWFNSSDGLKLYARDYRHQTPLATILCIPGLTRNSADFSQLCDHLAVSYRVLTVDLRGRGQSAYDPNPQNYHPGTYMQDIIALLDSLALDSVILIGTSLGGLVSMMLSATQPRRVTAAIINDIGTEVNRTGFDRIKSYVCKPAPVSTWDEAISKTRELQGREYPDFSDADWSAFTQNLYRDNGRGQPVLAYDPAIAVLLEQNQDNAVPPDLWPLFRAIPSMPLLLLRGELSNILTRECAQQMQREKPQLQFIEIANCGHTPLLTEQQSLQAIDQFLNTVTRAQAGTE